MAAADTAQGDTLSVAPFFAYPSLDTTPVEIQMRGIRWRVPRNFLESVNSASLRIVTTLSTLKGATPETLRCYKALRAEVCPDTIIILTQWLAAAASVWNSPAVIEAARDPRDDLFGLTKVNVRLSPLQRDVYVFYGGSFEESIVVQCAREGRESLQDCAVRFEVGKVPLLYSFARSQLANWRPIHAGVVAIIKSFVVSDAK